MGGKEVAVMVGGVVSTGYDCERLVAQAQTLALGQRVINAIVLALCEASTA